MATILDVLLFMLGASLVLFTINAAVRTFVLPRGDNAWFTRFVFHNISKIFHLWAHFADSELGKDRAWAMFAPAALLTLPVAWLASVTVGFAVMFWAVGVRPWYDAFLLSGSSLLTLGFAPVANGAQTLLAFLDAMIGLGLIALLIAYLPTMYSAFSRREVLVAKLEVYAGAPPSPAVIIARMHRIQGITYLSELFTMWETWFAELEESHTTFGPLNFFRSPKPLRSWVTAAGAILDSAALTLSVLDVPRQPRAALCIRSGYLALRSIADFFGFDYDPDPDPDDPISITRAEFDEVCAYLREQGVELKQDRDQAWRDFSGWRVNYDAVLIAIAAVTLAPPAPWSSDRAKLLPVRNQKRLRI